MKIEVSNNHIEEAIDLKDKAVRVAMEIIGINMEKYAKALAPVDTGNLRNSISHAVDENSVAVGTNVEYAPYQELGYTHVGGKYVPATNGGIGFLRPAVEDHLEEYKEIIKSELQNG
jgi:HK97 gp10 family phage protein